MVQITSVLKDVCEISLQNEMQKLNDLNKEKIECELVAEEKISYLAKKINLLPYEYSSILFLYYCFNITDYEIDEILGIKDTNGKLLYIRKMLSSFLGLDKSWIDNHSIKEACVVALSDNVKVYDHINEVCKNNYSNKLRLYWYN